MGEALSCLARDGHHEKLQRAQEVQQILLLAVGERVEVLFHLSRFRTAALVSLDCRQ